VWFGGCSILVHVKAGVPGVVDYHRNILGISRIKF